MGAILLNRARIGARSLVGAGALVTEDKSFEDGKMILGAPAKAVRDLSPEQMAGIEKSAAIYVANAQALCRQAQARLTAALFGAGKFGRPAPHLADAGVGLGPEIEPGRLVVGGVDDEQGVELAQLLHQRIADGVDGWLRWTGPRPGARSDAPGPG